MKFRFQQVLFPPLRVVYPVTSFRMPSFLKNTDITRKVITAVNLDRRDMAVVVTEKKPLSVIFQEGNFTEARTAFLHYANT